MESEKWTSPQESPCQGPMVPGAGLPSPPQFVRAGADYLIK